MGSILAGCAVERALGAGAMGQVFLARELDGGRAVVLKVLAPEIGENPELRARFGREGQALLKIRPHPNVMRIFGVCPDAAQPCLVVEYVEGISLREWLRERGKLPPQDALRVARDVARGLDVVHGHGLLHRDLKPANIIVDPQTGHSKVVDFGLAKDVFQTALTRDGQFLGTAPYLAPECWEKSTADARADVFALGVTLYELLTGERPFKGADIGQLGERIARGEFGLPSERVRGLPADADVLLLQMLVPEPRYRYAEMRDCADDIDRLLAGEPVLIPRLVESGGRGHPLLPGKKFLLGSDARCEPRIAHPTVSLQHAQVRRTADGYELRDFRGSSGTFVDDEPVAKKQILEHGQRVRLGELELVFHEPRSVRQDLAFLRDVQRERHADATVATLVALRDERIVLALLEGVGGCAGRARRAQAELTPLLGGQAANAVAQRVLAQAPQRAERALQLLGGITGQRLEPDPEQWLAWWDSVRSAAPLQVGPDRAPALQLVADGGASISLAEQGVVLIGRDPKCHLRLETRAVARLHTTLLRLHTRWIARDEGKAGGTCVGGAHVGYAFVDPGDVLTLGEDVTVRLVATPPSPIPGALLPVDPEWFQHLVDLGHPGVLVALVATLAAPRRTDWIQALARAANVPEQRFGATLLPLLNERAAHARTALATRLSRDLGPDPAAWQPHLARAAGGTQVAPAGWLP